MCDLSRMSMQHQWLALTVTSHQTLSSARTDGYSIILRSDTNQDSSHHTKEAISLKDGETLMGDDLAAEIIPSADQQHHHALQELPGPSQPQIDSQRSATRSNSGFCRFLCAEYLNGLTAR